MRRRAIPLLLATALALGACASPRLLTRAVAPLTPGVTYFVPTQERAVALTIDDGPDRRETPQILDVLARHDARATFFLIGSRVPSNEDLLARMQADSHEVANHTLEERASILVPSRTLETGLQATHDLLSPYGSVRWFRPGSGWINERVWELASRQGYATALGDVYPFDPLIPSSRFHAWYILRHVRSGSVIVLHDANGRGARTAATLEVVLPELRKRGYRVVTLTELRALEERSL